jgi:hypothetical protein
MDYYKKYLKYKNKYLELNGGVIIKNNKLSSLNIVDYYYLIMYHGRIDNTKKFIKLNNKTILSLGDCCGTVNAIEGYDKFYYTKSFNKSNIKSKFNLGNRSYITLEPNSKLCDFDLRSNLDDSITFGLHKIYFNKDILESKIINIDEFKDIFNKLYDIEYIKKILSITLSIDYKNFINHNIFINFINLFNFDNLNDIYNEVVLFNKINFIKKYILLETIFTTINEDNSKIKNVTIGNNYFSKLIKIFYFIFVKNIINNEEITTLSSLLDYIKIKEQDTQDIVPILLIACQQNQNNDEVCAIDKCYRIMRDVNKDEIFMLPKQIIIYNLDIVISNLLNKLKEDNEINFFIGTSSDENIIFYINILYLLINRYNILDKKEDLDKYKNPIVIEIYTVLLHSYDYYTNYVKLLQKFFDYIFLNKPVNETNKDYIKKYIYDNLEQLKLVILSNKYFYKIPIDYHNFLQNKYYKNALSPDKYMYDENYNLKKIDY